MGVSRWAVIPHCAMQGTREHSMAAQRRGREYVLEEVSLGANLLG